MIISSLLSLKLLIISKITFFIESLLVKYAFALVALRHN